MMSQVSICALFSLKFLSGALGSVLYKFLYVFADKTGVICSPSQTFGSVMAAFIFGGSLRPLTQRALFNDWKRG